MILDIKVHPQSATITTPPDTIVSIEPSIYNSPHHTLETKCSIFCSLNKRCIYLSTIIALLVIIATVVSITQLNRNVSNTSTNPCETYKTEDMASSVSLECFRYIWANAGCKSIVPDGYHGWWLRSPDGGKTIVCVPPLTGELCGAGSYGTIVNNAFRCNLDTTGY